MAANSLDPFTAFLHGVFTSVDKDSNGEIDENELQNALSNGTWMPFNIRTVRAMIKMFDKRGNDRVRFDEFGALWKYIEEWQNCFRSFDKDNSGFIDAQELHSAFTAFGYRFSPSLSHLMVDKFDRKHNGVLAFDDFIQCCLTVYKITDAFRQNDTDRVGVITIHYEQFLAMCLDSIST